MKRIALVAGIAIAALFVSTSAEATSILLNGNFENNTAGSTQFNMSNATFTATVANATAFGTAQEIDLITSTDFGITPQSGNWKLGLHTQVGGPQDAFSFSLSSAVVGGTSYTLSFFGALLAGQPPGTIEVGISTSASSFGTLVYSATPFFTSQWQQLGNVFVAPSNASFLTVRTSAFEGYSFVDNFTLDPASTAVPEPGTMTLLGVGLAAGAWRRLRSLRRRTIT